MNLEINKVYSIKLNSGEEMVAKVLDITDNYIVILDPLSVAPNRQGMGLIPSMFTSGQNKNITLNLNSIAMYAESDDTIQTKYLEATTGISVPDKKIILG